MHPRAQRKNAAKTKKQSFKELPEGWTREKVGAKYAVAPSKTLFLKKWGEKYLTMQKAKEWENLVEDSDTE